MQQSQQLNSKLFTNFYGGPDYFGIHAGTPGLFLKTAVLCSVIARLASIVGSFLIQVVICSKTQGRAEFPPGRFCKQLKHTSKFEEFLGGLQISIGMATADQDKLSL